jgi:WD40 repeat protein
MQTKGHIAALKTAQWHPTDRNVCMTASIDGTVRLWDINTCAKKQVTVIKTKNARGQKCNPTAACYSPKGDILAACDDGTIKVYDGRAVAKGSTQRAHSEAKTAHAVGSETSSISASRDGNTLISRGGDDSLKVWDLRKLSSALASFEGLDNYFETTQCIFSPGDHLFLTGTSVRKNKDGRLPCRPALSLPALHRGCRDCK